MVELGLATNSEQKEYLLIPVCFPFETLMKTTSQ